MESRKNMLGEWLEDYLSERGYPVEDDMEDLCEICAGVVGREPLFRPAFKNLSVASLRSFKHVYNPTVPPALPDFGKIFFNSRVEDYSGAHYFYDIWLYDLTLDSTVVNGVGILYEMGLDETFLRILDGRECRLPAKDSPCMITKRSNVSVVVIMNDPPFLLFQGLLLLILIFLLLLASAFLDSICLIVALLSFERGMHFVNQSATKIRLKCLCAYFVHRRSSWCLVYQLYLNKGRIVSQ
jgi:hypothetical protein